MTTLVRPTMTAAEIQQLTQKNRERAAAQRLEAKAPTSSLPEPALAAAIRLKVTDVVAYERNPRHASHERIAELKESIRVNGIEQIVTVTRRPNQKHYVVAKGGNSRLLAAQALYEETRSPEFLHREFLYVEYPGEARLLAAHLRENDQRADLCFWDKANGYLTLKADLERETGKTLSLREFSRILADEGSQISQPTLGFFKFAIDRLAGLGEAATLLTGKDISVRIQPRFGSISRLAQKLGLDEDWVQHEIIDPELELVRMEFDHTQILDVDRLVEGFHRRCADKLEVSRAGLETMLGVLDKVPGVSAEDLRASIIQPQKTGLLSASDQPRALEDDDEDSGDPNTETAECGVACAGNRSRPPLELTNSPTQHCSRPSILTVFERPTTEGSAVRTRQSNTRSEYPVVTSATASPMETGAAPDRLWDALERFAGACGLAGCLRETSALPYGFMVEPPALEPDEPALDRQAVESEAARRRYHGWWWLVSLSQQNSPAGVAVVPDSAFGRMIETDDTWQEACDTWIGEQLLSDRFYLMFFAILDPGNAAGGLYLDLMAAARAFRESHPERFAPQFWLVQGVDERLVQLG